MKRPGAPEEDPTLREIVSRLVEAVDPEKLILFGSRAKGQGGPTATTIFSS
jgi:hypothetical protein